MEMIKFKLKSKDREIFEVDQDVAFQSKLLKRMVDDLGITEANAAEKLKDPLPLINVDGWTLKKLLEWCVIHRGEVYREREEHEDPRVNLTEGDNNWMDVTSDQLLAMLLGANFMDIPAILDIITQKIANMATDKTVEEMREIYNLPNDLNPDEEEALRLRFSP